MLATLPILLALSGAPGGKVYLTVEEALKLAFPGARIERRTVYLTEEERGRAGELSGAPIDHGVVHPYVATVEGACVGTAWFDVHRVRTKNETVMFVIGPDRKLARIELLSFAEPEEYVPRGRWYAQFVGRGLDKELELERGIKPVVGATLTARATTEAARRVLALHEVVFPRP